MDFNALMNMDMSSIDIELPEDFGDRIMEHELAIMQIAVELAQHLYDPEPTQEQITEAGTLLILYAKKRIGEMCSPPPMDTEG